MEQSTLLPNDLGWHEHAKIVVRVYATLKPGFNASSLEKHPLGHLKFEHFIFEIFQSRKFLTTIPLPLVDLDEFLRRVIHQTRSCLWLRRMGFDNALCHRVRSLTKLEKLAIETFWKLNLVKTTVHPRGVRASRYHNPRTCISITN